MNIKLFEEDHKYLLTIITVAKANNYELNKTYESLKKPLFKNKELIQWVLVLSGDFKILEKK